MSYRFPIYRHHGSIFLVIFGLLLVAITIFLLAGATEAAFERLGFSRFQVVLILVGSFAGALVNIPLWRVKSVQRVLESDEISFFGITYRIPHIAVREVSTLVAVNLGGALIPLAVSLYLLRPHPKVLTATLLGILLTSIVVHFVAQRVPGLGIATPAFVPPITAALVAYVLSPTLPSVVAYVSGTLGTLIGADLTNLHGIGELGAPVASIGGAGTFDGIFLAGILAVLLV